MKAEKMSVISSLILVVLGGGLLWMDSFKYEMVSYILIIFAAFQIGSLVSESIIAYIKKLKKNMYTWKDTYKVLRNEMLLRNSMPILLAVVIDMFFLEGTAHQQTMIGYVLVVLINVFAFVLTYGIGREHSPKV